MARGAEVREVATLIDARVRVHVLLFPYTARLHRLLLMSVAASLLVREVGSAVAWFVR